MLASAKLNGHNVTNSVWMMHTMHTAASQRGEYRDAFEHDQMFRELRTYKDNQYRWNSQLRFKGVIPDEHHFEMPSEIGVLHKKNMPLTDGTQAAVVVALPQACHLYQYFGSGHLKDEVIYPMELRRLSLACTPDRLRWMLSYTLSLPLSQVDAIFMSVTKIPISRHLILGSPHVEHRVAFDLLRDILEKYVRIQMGLPPDNPLLAPREDPEPEPDAAMLLEYTGEEQIGQSYSYDLLTTTRSRDYYSVVFASHPESKRFFGHRRFFELSHMYDEQWLMGLSMDELDKLHSSVSENPYHMCFAGHICSSWAATEHEYLAKGQIDLAIQEVSWPGFLRGLQAFGYQNTKSEEVVDVLVYNAVKCGIFEQDTYSTALTIMETIRSHPLFMNQLGVNVKLSTILESLARLHKRRSVYVHCSEGEYAEQFASEEGIRYFDQLKIYHTKVYESEAILVATIYQIFCRALDAHLSGTPLFVSPPTKKTKKRLCSEQMFLLDNIASRPVTNIFGPGGVGKTFALHTLGELLGDQILFLAFQNRHVNVLAKKSTRRCSTLHMILKQHENYCQDALDCYTKESSSYRALHKIQVALRSKSVEREQNTDYRLTTYDRVWCNCKKCPLENLVAVCFDEVSTTDRALLQRTLFTIFRCAKNLRAVFFAGDPKQLPSMGYGDLIMDLIFGLGGFEFLHTHRSNMRTLRRNADLVAGKHMPIIFDGEDMEVVKNDPSSERAIQRVIFYPCTPKPESLFSVLNEAVENHNFSMHNTQFITRTNEVRRMSCNFVRNLMLGLPLETTGHLYRGQKVMFRRGCIGEVGAGQVMMTWGVVWARPLVKKDKDVSPFEREAQTVCEIVQASQLMQLDQNDNPENVSEYISRLAAGDLDIPEALYTLTDTLENRKTLVRQGLIPLHPDIMIRMKGDVDRKRSCGAGSVTSLSNYCATICNLFPNTTFDSVYRQSGAKQLIACISLDDDEVASMPELTYFNLRELILQNRIFFLPYFGRDYAEDATVLTVAAMQGSASRNIVHVMLRDSEYETCRTLTTAIGRAESCYVAIGQRKAFDNAARRIDRPRRSDFGFILRELQMHFEKFFGPMNYAAAALLEVQEIQARRKFFDHLPEHPKLYIRRYAEQLGQTIPETEASLAAQIESKKKIPEIQFHQKIENVCQQFDDDFDDEDLMILHTADNSTVAGMPWVQVYDLLLQRNLPAELAHSARN